jgi:Zn-dependent peptidase ImmA (M78 family)
MEIITENILTDAGYSLNCTGDPRAVLVDEIIEFHYKLDISWEEISHFCQEDLTMAAIIPKERKIILNDSCKNLFEEKIGTLNFTMAHELGHWVLHVEDKLNQQTEFSFDNIDDTFYCRSFSKKPPIEYQADMFAGCLLMPKPIIAPMVNVLKETSNTIKFPQLYRMCDLFQVSISALKVRLHELNLLYIHNGSIYKSKEECCGQLTLGV